MASRFLFSVILSVFFIQTGASAQTFSKSSIAQGYEYRADTTWFLFDTELYGQKNVEKVVVTGAFAGWSHDMNDKSRIMKSVDGGKLWIVGFPNP